MIDYHHHSACSVDSTASMAAICEAAIARGVTEIAFTEHMDFIPEQQNTGYFAYDRYMREVAACRRRYDGRLVVLAAVEIDYCPDFEDEIAAWMHGKEFDFVVGSVHYLRGKGNISEPRAAGFFRGKDIEEAYGEYFEVVRRSAEFGLWDALGHLDLVKRYGVRRFGAFDRAAFADVIDDILHAIIRHGMALEVNASGLRQGPAETYPAPAILLRYRELGGMGLSVGSDSHAAQDVGRGVSDALRIARDLGFTSVLRFRERRSMVVPIDEIVS